MADFSMKICIKDDDVLDLWRVGGIFRLMGLDAKRFTTLSQCARVRAGFPFRGAVDSLAPGPVAVIQMRNVESDAVDWPSLTRVTLPTKRSADVLVQGDVIFTTRGRRNLALALDEMPGAAVCSPHFFVFQVLEPGRLLPAFLAWQVNQKSAQEYLRQAATGSYILNITRAAIESLPLAIPSLEVQRAIVELADAAGRERELVNALIENRQRQLDAVAAHLLAPERYPA
jgi:hypothetical protein